MSTPTEPIAEFANPANHATRQNNALAYDAVSAQNHTQHVLIHRKIDL
jgi:hypothetical protein